MKKTQYEKWHNEVKTNGWDNYKFRASQIGKLATKPKGKSSNEIHTELTLKLTELEIKKVAILAKIKADKDITKTEEKVLNSIVDTKEKIAFYEKKLDEPNLSDTAKSYLADLWTEIMYGRREDIKNKYIEKGLLLEEDAITQHSLITKKMYRKNTVQLENEFATGEFDYEDEDTDTVKDAKVNWSIFQFNRTAAKPINSLYMWQGKTYMWLSGRKNFELVYSLLNTPEHLIKQEENKLRYDLPANSDFEQAVIELRKNHIYDDIPMKDKERIYYVTHNDEDIDFIKNQIIQARKYLNNFSKLKTLNDGTGNEEVD